MSITYVPSNSAYSDYRPVFSPGGDQVLYERTYLPNNGPTLLWIYTLGARQSQLFIPDPPSGVGNQTRPDWSWSGNNRIAFAGEDNGSSVWLVDSNGSNCTQISGTSNMTYPAWYPNGDYLAVMTTGAPPGPLTNKIDLRGNIVAQVTDPHNVYAGMPSVDQANGATVAFAGQQNNGQPYNQFDNQIWLTNPGAQPWQLDPPAQGRAPWISPNGEWIAFESNRGGNGYAIYIAPIEGGSATEIPDTAPGGQHPKWSPDGQSLVCVLKPHPDEPNRIGIIDVSPYLK